MILVLFSAGWAVPLYISIHFFWRWRQFASPFGYAQQPQLNSFPYLDAAQMHWQVACIWLGIVLLFWTIVRVHRSHFSMRTMLLAITLIAVLLGLGAWLAR